MQTLSQTGIGSTAAIQIPHSDKIAVQLHVTGTATFQVNGRVSPDAPWMPVVASASADSIQSIAWYPELQLQVTVGAGTVELYASYGIN